MNKSFKLVSPYTVTGDQPRAVDSLSDGILKGYKEQTLMGVTGSGKTFTMANIIANLNRPTLVLAHNKTLAAQLCSEFREFFPENAVEYFVSYYDYYQPEAYVPGKDLYIEKDSSINSEIDKLRHSATSSLFERRDVIIVSSVSCIYSLGDPEDYQSLVLSVRVGMQRSRDNFIARLVDINYQRNDFVLERGNFRVRGDVVEVLPANTDTNALRVEFFGDEIDRISEINIVTGEVTASVSYASIYPASHYVTTDEKREAALEEIEAELEERVNYFKQSNRFIEAQRIEERTRYDMEMLREIGYCSGVENYSRVFSGRPVGSTPYTLLDYFPKDFVLFIDESHVTIPQVRGMSGGDYARKHNLVEYGFRLPSAYDNRPLVFDEFMGKLNQIVYVSATPAAFERERSQNIAEQIIRPTGLCDPQLEVRGVEGQIDDLIGEINACTAKGQRILVTTLTKKMAEDLTEFLENNNIKVRYMHHDIETMERTEILRNLRLGLFDVLVGINLLREGIDLPEVSLVAILDADKEGFLRSETSLMQIIGRAARHVEGKVIMYADKVTDSMSRAISETNRRRAIQQEHNKVNGIIPRSIKKDIRDLIEIASKDELERSEQPMSDKDREKLISKMTEQMKAAAKQLDFESAAYLRDKIAKLKSGK
ncbi:MAG: excinuclease ABC subunit UvrB [Eubacteriales bacterium]